MGPGKLVKTVGCGNVPDKQVQPLLQSSSRTRPQIRTHGRDASASGQHDYVCLPTDNSDISKTSHEALGGKDAFSNALHLMHLTKQTWTPTTSPNRDAVVWALPTETCLRILGQQHLCTGGASDQDLIAWRHVANVVGAHLRR